MYFTIKSSIQAAFDLTERKPFHLRPTEGSYGLDQRPPLTPELLTAATPLLSPIGTTPSAPWPEAI